MMRRCSHSCLFVVDLRGRTYFKNPCQPKKQLLWAELELTGAHCLVSFKVLSNFSVSGPILQGIQRIHCVIVTQPFQNHVHFLNVSHDDE